MAASNMGGRNIVGLDAGAVRASVQVVSQASASDLARPRISSAGRQGRQRPTR